MRQKKACCSFRAALFPSPLSSPTPISPVMICISTCHARAAYVLSFICLTFCFVLSGYGGVVITLSVEEGSIRALFLEVDESYNSLGTLNDNGPIVVSGDVSLGSVTLGEFRPSLTWPYLTLPGLTLPLSRAWLTLHCCRFTPLSRKTA